MTDGFKVVERIGGGEFLDLWTGVHQATNTNVHVHILDKKKLGNAFDTNRFNQLCDFVLTLNHPNVLKCYKVVANDKSIAVVTEPIQGRSLRDYLVEKNNKRLPEIDARLILRQIVEGVSYLHANNIVHRNLTLHNIYISSQGDIRLGNLLICAKSTDMGKPVTNQKSDCYFFAPELWDPNQEHDSSCDLWSIGVILYVLVCGCYPFDGKNEISVYLAAKHARFMIPNFITAECSSLIRQLLMPAKEARMKLEEIKYHPWYNNFSAAPLLRQSSSQNNSFGYSLHTIPESVNENEDQQVKQEDSSNANISLSDFGVGYAFNIPLDVGPNTTAPIVEIPTTDNENNNNNSNSESPEMGRSRRYSYSLPSSPVPTTLEEILLANEKPIEYSARAVRIPPGRKRSADQEQLLAMIPNRQGSFSMDDPGLPNLGTTPPQPRKRTGSINESKEIINMLEMPALETEVNTLSSDFAGLGTEDTGSATSSPAKGRRKKSDPSSPKSPSKKGSQRRTYRRRSLDDFSHLMVGPNTNPDIPTYAQVFHEAPKESSFGFQPVPQPQGTPGAYSPTMARSPTTPSYSVHSPAPSPGPISPMSPLPMSPVIYPGVPNDFATLAFLEHQQMQHQHQQMQQQMQHQQMQHQQMQHQQMQQQMQHMASNPDLPVQPPKITPMVFYAPPDIPQDPSHQYLAMQYQSFMQGGLYQPPLQTSQFDVPTQYFPVPATDSETMSAPIDTGGSHKHVSNFVGSVIPETEEEWANNVVNRKCDVICLTDRLDDSTL